MVQHMGAIATILDWNTKFNVLIVYPTLGHRFMHAGLVQEFQRTEAYFRRGVKFNT